MRWTRKVARNPHMGDRRTIRCFLWWPVCIGGEVRWLEVAAIEESYEPTPTGYEWVNVAFVSPPEAP